MIKHIYDLSITRKTNTIAKVVYHFGVKIATIEFLVVVS